MFEEVRARHGDLPMGKLAQPVRVAVTGGAVSPGIYETLAVLGKPRSLERLAAAIQYLRPVEERRAVRYKDRSVAPLPGRLTAGQQALNLFMVVRIHPGEPTSARALELADSSAPPSDSSR